MFWFFMLWSPVLEAHAEPITAVYGRPIEVHMGSMAVQALVEDDMTVLTRAMPDVDAAGAMWFERMRRELLAPSFLSLRQQVSDAGLDPRSLRLVDIRPPSVAAVEPFASTEVIVTSRGKGTYRFDVVWTQEHNQTGAIMVSGFRSVQADAPAG